VRKAAILMVAMGEEIAKKMIQSLPESDVQRLTEEIAELRNVTADVSRRVIEDFYEMLETQEFVSFGGLDYATKLLMDSFGKQRADDLLKLVKRAQEANHGNLAMLQKVDPLQLGKFLDNEQPQTAALVLAHLDPKRASIVLQALSEEQRVKAIFCIEDWKLSGETQAARHTPASRR
jgi:flagellar motor switch protein FliG